MPTVDVNWLVVLAGVVISMVLGFVWYTPAVFGNRWMKELGKKQGEMGSATTGYLWMALSSAILTYVMIHFVSYSGAATAAEGAVAGFWLWLGFAATIGLSKVAFEGRSWTSFAIDYGYLLLQYIVIAMVIVSWM